LVISEVNSICEDLLSIIELAADDEDEVAITVKE
jgi:hypothetical protein